jgi:hypothetical protein
LWLTPSCVQIEPNENRRQKRTEYRNSVGRKDSPVCLAEQVGTPKFWPTPSAQTAGEGPLLETLETKEGDRAQPGERAYNPKTRKHVQMTLNRHVKLFPTPTNSMMTLGDMDQARFSGNDSKRPKYNKIQKGSLNAQFVEWLMGYPKDWTDLEANNIKDHHGWIEDLNTPRLIQGQTKRTSRLKCLGNSILPQIAGLLFNLIKDQKTKETVMSGIRKRRQYGAIKNNK